MDFSIKRYVESDNNIYQIKWARELLSNKDIDKTTNYYLSFLIDISGSMNDNIRDSNTNTNTNTNINTNNLTLTRQSSISVGRYQNNNNSGISKISVIKETIEKCMFLLSELNKSGMNIYINLTTFNNETTKVFPQNEEFGKIDIQSYQYIKSNINKWFQCYGSTNMTKGFYSIKQTIEKQKELSNTNPFFYSLLFSDGENTDGDISNLINDYKGLFNKAIGIGSIYDYNYRLFCDLVNEINIYSAPNASLLRDYFIQTVFGTTTKVATDVKIQVDKTNNIITPHSCEQKEDTILIELPTFHSHRYIFFVLPQSSPINIYYKNNNNKELINSFESVEMDSNIEESKAILYYCKMSQIFSNIMKDSDENNKKREISKLYEELKKYNYSSDDTGVNGYLNALLNNVKNLEETKEPEEFMSATRQLSSQVNTGNYSSIQRQVSNQYANNNKMNHNLSVGLSDNCIVCIEEAKKVVFRPCSHLSCCKECTKNILFNKKECPICRIKINNIYEISVPDTVKNFMCQKCNRCHINSFNLPCLHASVCNTCNIGNCFTCQKKVDRVIVFKSS